MNMERAKTPRTDEEAKKNGPAVGGEFYSGIEWMGAWLLDHAEGETVMEERLRSWAAEAWNEYLLRQQSNPPVK